MIMRRTKSVLMLVLALTVTFTFLALIVYPSFLSNLSTTKTVSNLIHKQSVAFASNVKDENFKLIIKPDFGVHSIAFSPDGKYIVAGGDYSKACVWHVESGQLVRKINHSAVVEAVAYSPDGKFLATGTWDTYRVENNKTVNLWDPATGALVMELSPPYGPEYNAGVTAMTFSYDSRYLIVSYSGSGRANNLVVYDVIQGTTVGTIKDHMGAYRLAFSPDNKYLAYGNYKKNIYIVEFSTRNVIKSIDTGFAGFINSIVFSPDNRLIAASSVDKTIKIWNFETGKPQKTLVGHKGQVVNIVFSPDSKYIYSGSYDKKIIIWDANTGRAMKDLEINIDSVFAVSFSKDGRYIAAGHKSIVILDLMEKR